MTFSPSVPLNSDSPSIFPAQNQTNMARLQTIIGADHQFNLSAAANDGYHNIVHLTQQAPSGVLAATGRSYAKSSAGRIHQFYMDDQGTEYQITPTMPLRAAVSFNNTPIEFARYNVNIGGVTKISTGIYRITFATPMPDTTYLPIINGQGGGGVRVYGSVRSAGTYTMNASFLDVMYTNSSGSATDVNLGFVVIFSVT